MEHDLLAGEILGVVLGEGDVDVLLLTGLHADDLILKAGNEAARADLQLVVLALAALEGNAVVKALEVDDGGIALLDLAVDGNEAGLTLGHLVQALLDVVRRDLDLFLHSAHALVLAQLDLGIDRDGCLEGEAVLADLIVHDLDLGVAYHIEAAGADGLCICFGERGIHSVAVEHALAVELFDHFAGRLAGTEAGHADLIAHLEIRLLNGGFKLLGSHFDGDGNLALFELFNRLDIHVSFSSVLSK